MGTCWRTSSSVHPRKPVERARHGHCLAARMRLSYVVGVIGLVALVAVMGNACGGKADAGPGTTTDASPQPQPDASTGRRAPDCPETDPQDGTPCSKDGLLCEYGDDFNPLCNVTRVCSTDRWAEPIHNGGSGKCPSTPHTIPPNPADCAADAKSTPSGACSSKSTCTYDGAICTCGVFCSNYPIRRPDCDADAGVTTNCCDTTKVEWHCFEGPKYCTTPRPRIGAPCANDGESCAVSEPVECGQTVMKCQKGVWDLEGNQCSASSAKVKREIAYIDGAQSSQLHEELMSVRL